MTCKAFKHITIVIVGAMVLYFFVFTPINNKINLRDAELKELKWWRETYPSEYKRAKDNDFKLDCEGVCE